MEKANNKGQLNGLTGNIITLVVAIIILVLGLVVVQEMRDIDLLSNQNTRAVTNETITPTTTGVAVAGTSSPGANGFGSAVVVNDSVTGQVITDGNYTFSTAGVLSNTTGEFVDSSWFISYAYLHGDEAYLGTNSSLVGLGNFSDFIPIIVIALAASIIIGLILLGFAFNRKQR